MVLPYASVVLDVEVLSVVKGYLLLLEDESGGVELAVSVQHWEGFMELVDVSG